jgi:hypothetical protein
LISPGSIEWSVYNQHTVIDGRRTGQFVHHIIIKKIVAFAIRQVTIFFMIILSIPSYILICLFGFAVNVGAISVLVVTVQSGTTKDLRFRVLLGMANGKFLMGSRPAAPEGIGMFRLLGMIFGRGSIVVLKVQGIYTIPAVSTQTPCFKEPDILRFNKKVLPGTYRLGSFEVSSWWRYKGTCNCAERGRSV